MLAALCQGGADHYVKGKKGLYDFDVWTFLAEHPKLTAFPPRRNKPRDFGNPTPRTRTTSVDELISSAVQFLRAALPSSQSNSTFARARQGPLES